MKFAPEKIDLKGDTFPLNFIWISKLFSDFCEIEKIGIWKLVSLFEVKARKK
jgi:hypothetical protein